MAKKAVKKSVTPLGTKAYAVSKAWIDKGAQSAGAKVIPCKLLTYENEGGKVTPIYKSLLSKQELSEKNWYIYSTLDEAVEAIRSKPTKKKK